MIEGSHYLEEEHSGNCSQGMEMRTVVGWWESREATEKEKIILLIPHNALCSWFIGIQLLIILKY